MCDPELVEWVTPRGGGAHIVGKHKGLSWESIEGFFILLALRVACDEYYTIFRNPYQGLLLRGEVLHDELPRSPSSTARGIPVL
jgi:hypothetical protein